MPDGEKHFFDGEFSQWTRNFLRLRRQSAGLTYREAGAKMRVSPATVKKWEDGTIRRCHDRQKARVAAFLYHDFNAERRAEDYCVAILQEMPITLTSRLGRLIKVYECVARQGRGREMAAELDTFLQECFCKLRDDC